MGPGNNDEKSTYGALGIPTRESNPVEYHVTGRERDLALFFSHLAARKVDYCILHPFPEKVSQAKGDLDLYIGREGFPEAESHLLENGWTEDRSFRFRRGRRYFSKVVQGIKLKLDISMDYALYGKRTRFLYTGQVRKQTGKDGRPYLDDFSGFCFLFEKASLKNGQIQEDKVRDINRLMDRCEEVKALPRLREGADCRLHMEFAERHFESGPAQRISLPILMSSYLQRLVPATGSRTVAFVGLDGAGKGTYLDLFCADLSARNIHFRCCYMGYAGFRIPLLRFLYRLKSDRNPLVVRKLLQGACFLLLPMDFLIRRGRGRYDLLLTDRHPLYEPVFSSGFMSLYDGLIARISPRPSLVIYLTGKAEDLWERKRDIGFEEYQQRKKKLDRIVQLRSEVFKTVQIDTIGNIPEVFRRIQDAIEQHG